MAEDDPALIAIADGLYALAPEEFTEARDRQVDQALGEGRPNVANVIKTWRRPKTSAWLVNTLAREHADQLSQLYELDAALREAQQRGAGDQLRALTRQRRKIVDELVSEARSLADNAGHRISESVVREVEATLQAALADPRAADAVRTGRLLTALSSNGFDPVDLDGAVVLQTEPESSGPTRSRRPVRTDAEPDDGAHARLDEARAVVQDAAAGSAQAEQGLSATEQALNAAEERAVELRSRVTELEEALAQARAAAGDADQELRAARRARSAAEQDVRVARRRMAAAESKLERLEP
ncbi:MAG: hypothetical protein ABJA86_11145 [Nocardioidaceae bacterium]